MVDPDLSVAEVMADNNRLIEEFLTACDDFSKALEKHMTARAELMNALPPQDAA